MEGRVFSCAFRKKKRRLPIKTGQIQDPERKKKMATAGEEETYRNMEATIECDKLEESPNESGKGIQSVKQPDG